MNAYDINVNKGDKIKHFGVYFIKTNNKMTSDEQSNDVIYNLYIHTYNVDSSFIVNSNFSNAGISYKYHLNQNSEDLF